MDIHASSIPQTWLWVAAVLYFLLMLVAAVSAPWSKIRDNEAQHVFLGIVVGLCLLWAMRGGLQPGLGFHLLGMTLMCLMFEWQFALLGASALVAVMTALGRDDLMPGDIAPGVDGQLAGERVCLYACQRRLPHNFFIYVLINAFLVGAFSILLAGAASAAVQYLGGVYPGPTIYQNFLQILPLLMFGEGFINGGAMALVVAYRPRWVATFHDGWYLQGK